MTLVPGTRLGPYQIETPLGEGGMGAVYRARDTRLGRTVALKVIIGVAAMDAGARERFGREARAVASLNHPHICALYDVGCEMTPAETDGVAGRSADGVGREPIDYLVMEYLQGETLEHRLHGVAGAERRKPLKVDEAVQIGLQVAEALAAAHAAGVVHRDLKPANVMLTPAGAKLLDFGIAKSRDVAVAGVTNAATVAAATPVTTPGVVVGTVGYMSPEQARGDTVDSRADLFALGCLLHEMLSGERCFTGATATDVLTAILRDDPPALSADRVPAALDRVVRHCLEKDRSKRFQSARDIAFALDSFGANGQSAGVPAAGAAARGRASRFVFPIAVLSVVAAAALGWYARGTPAPQTVHGSLSVASAGLTLTSGGVAISPDGRTIAFVAFKGEEVPRIHVRRLDDPEPRALAGTENAQAPFFKPDGQWLAFASNGVLKKVMLATGELQVLCKIGYQGFSRGFWNADGLIYFTYWPGGLYRISESAPGSKPEMVLSSGSESFLWPQILPDGRRLLLTVPAGNEGRVVVLTLASGSSEGPRTVLPRAGCARYLPGGYLVYLSEGKLQAVRVDPTTLRPLGSPRIVLDDVAVGRTASNVALDYDVSASGDVLALPARFPSMRIAVRDRAGNASYPELDARNYAWLSMAGDGRRFAVTLYDWPATRIWAGRLDGEPVMPLSPGGREMCALYSHDGRTIVFSAAVAGAFNLFRRASDGSGEDVRLTDSPGQQRATCFLPKDDRVLFNDSRSDEWQRDVAEVALGGGALARPVVRTAANELEGVVSPDGRWLAYQSDETGPGKWEVYVRAYAASGKGQQVSVGDGMGPVWSPKGDEIYYQSRTALMAVPFHDGRAGRPAKLFAVRKAEDYRREIDVLPDGRLVFLEPATPRTEMVFVQNWVEALKAKMK